MTVIGDQVALAGTAKVDVSGNSGGGSAFIGGLAYGAGPKNATTTTIAQGATVNADARRTGPGGQIVVWSQKSTSVAGSLSAKGGAKSGDGGFIETSSKGALGVTSTGICQYFCRQRQSRNLAAGSLQRHDRQQPDDERQLQQRPIHAERADERDSLGN